MMCKSGHLIVLHYLLELGADPHIANIYGDTPLFCKYTPVPLLWAIHFCCKAGHLVVLHYLLEQGADPHIANIYGDTRLHL